jgi:ketosteroid isomerase-like protein
MSRILMIFALTALGAAAVADPQHEVKCREIGFSKSVESRNSEQFRLFIDPDARFVGNSVSKGIDAIVERWSIFLTVGGSSIKWRPQFVEVLEDGKLALTRGPYKMTTTDEDGTVTEHWGTFNSVWRLSEDGQWRVVFDAGDGSDEAPEIDVQGLLDKPDECHIENSW